MLAEITYVQSNVAAHLILTEPGNERKQEAVAIKKETIRVTSAMTWDVHFSEVVDFYEMQAHGPPGPFEPDSIIEKVRQRLRTCVLVPALERRKRQVEALKGEARTARAEYETFIKKNRQEAARQADPEDKFWGHCRLGGKGKTLIYGRKKRHNLVHDHNGQPWGMMRKGRIAPVRAKEFEKEQQGNGNVMGDDNAEFSPKVHKEPAVCGSTGLKLVEFSGR